TDNVNFMASSLTDQVRNIALVTTAVAKGDLSQKITVEAKGEILELKNTINTMVDQLGSFADEVTRVARDVGTDGKLGVQAQVPGVAGTWKDLTDSVNFMASNLTDQVRNIALVTTAVANGDLSQKITVDVRGEILELKNTINTMVDQLNGFAAEVTRVAKDVGTEGVLGGQAQVPGVGGVWKDLTDNVNSMASNLTEQVRGIARVVTAVANGDMNQKFQLQAKGEVAALAETINGMIDTLSTFADQVTTVAREVGTEGKLGGQANVPNVAGTWKDLTDSVNSMASNLTDQVRNIALVTTAVAKGDLSQKISVDVRGEMLNLKDTINTMVDQLGSFADEVTRVAREVGTEGKLGVQARVQGVSGVWKDLTDNVNFMASNLTDQVRNIALVTTAVANGDLSQKITVDVKGEILELKNTINTMVVQLGSFADEVTRVAREVGTEGKLGVQAKVPNVSGTWKDLTENVNFMASNLTDQVRDIALVTTAVANGDLSQKITVDVKGEILELKNTINKMVDQLNGFAAEVTRVARDVGTEGVLGGQARVMGVSGVWKELTDNVNFMASNLTTQVRGIVRVVTAVATGDLTQKFQLQAKGEVAALAETINSMIDTLSIFADQVTTVARDVGTEGILGGQAKVPGVAGTWKDLTDSVNVMAANLTTQVRGIAKVVTAVADGDLKQNLTLQAKGEVAALAETINSMTDTLQTFADQVITVAREVGTEGKLGGQARVPGVAGTWKDLTDNVNFMANSLTTQVRAIQDVATAVAQGDLSRTVTVDAQGEVQALKDNINQMIANLRTTTDQNREQDWLKTNLANSSRMMQGQKTLESVAQLIMSELTPLVGAHHGVFFIADGSGNDLSLRLLRTYGYRERKHLGNRFQLGDGLVGQCALEKKSILLTNVPQDYIQINSGLGEAPPRNVIVLPVLFEGEVLAVIELASFNTFSQIHQTFLDQLTESIGVVLNMIQANMRTEELLKQSQSLTQELQSQSQELQSQQEQLKQTNVELEHQATELEAKAAQLAEQNRKVEQKNREVELARAALEEQAEQLALSSRYKSEFLANMSHELRTPLNSMMILAKLLADNPSGGLTEKETEFAKTIHSSGGDLLNLINEILDLSKIEAGKMEIDVHDHSLKEVADYVQRTFRPIADQKGLEFRTEVSPVAPATVSTDVHRLQQILRNLLGNAFKFTAKGSVTMTIGPADRDVVLDNGTLCPANELLEFRVEDTGIGIAKDKQRLIFEAFQQADGNTNRRYGGTGLGLTISRDITRLLGGRIRVESETGEGSTFILYLPINYTGPALDSNSDKSSAVGYAYADHAVNAISEIRQTTTVLTGPSDDRASIEPGDRVVVVIEDDATYAGILQSIAQKQGFKVVVAHDGQTGLQAIRRYNPSAVTLDIKLPDIDGWKVLDELKRDPATRHIPVQVVSVVNRQKGAAMGAISFLEKPVTPEALEGAFAHIKEYVERDVKELLIVEDNEAQRNSLIEMLSEADVRVTAASNGEEALEALANHHFDSVILDLSLPDMGGLEILKKIRKKAQTKETPVVIYTGKDLSKQEEAQIKRYATSIITKGATTSTEQLVDETSLFLHRAVEKLQPAQRAMVESRIRPASNGNGDLRPAPAPAPKGPGLANRRILVVDDDVRNIFALTSMLEARGMEVLFEENGNDAIQTLVQNPGIDAVLMDVMMPVVDGYETTARIRAMEGFERIPIIALTAKAMEGDREKCLESGASDYITKPVDTAALLEMLERWIGGTAEPTSVN
ncbi:response regulator, partial [bacterium]